MTKLELDEEKRRYKWGNMESENTFIKKEEEEDIKTICIPI